MKYLLKSSFALILLMAVFNIGVTNAYAVEKKASDTNKIEKVDASLLNFSLQENINLRTNLKDCEEDTILLEDYTVIIIYENCDIVIVPPPGEGDPILIRSSS